MAESTLEDTKKELEGAQVLKEAAESQRDDLTSRLQAVLTLLGAATGNQVLIHVRLTRVGSCQINRGWLMSDSEFYHIIRQ